MIQKYTFGAPFETDAVVALIPAASGTPAFGNFSADHGFSFAYDLSPDHKVYGLGEANRGIDKRGYVYVSCCSDDPIHTEDKHSLYGAHNFIIVSGGSDAPGRPSSDSFGLFFDYPGTMTFDIGYSHRDLLTVSCDKPDLYLYMITGEDPYDIVRQFRRIIGKSYIPPKFAFGYGQSRWGYTVPDDFRKVADQHREHDIPLDMIYMDIEYMDHYKDFTVDPQNFPDFPAFVNEMKQRDIRLIPIIDAGVKVEPGYQIYEEGVEKGYFCKREDGTEFEACVWPGMTHFPDFLNHQARKWFGDQYKFLLDAGIEGFWNDMNEPAIFFSAEGEAEIRAWMEKILQGELSFHSFDFSDRSKTLANRPEDYCRFYHDVNGKRVRHDQVHNLYGANMSRAAGEAFVRLVPDKRILMFSRASYIGMHRYSGIWTGDNMSWWSHILLNLKMLPSLNMCGFLYIGADLGGFGCDATEDLMLRWLALGVFTPLMRNHSAAGTREQEFYQFDHPEDFRHVIQVRYRLIPYLYSEYLKAAQNDDLMFKPLAFVYSQDRIACGIEDQLILGNETMIAPIYTQNAIGRPVYLPEEMMLVKFLPDGTLYQEIMPAGHHFIEVALNEVPLFIRKDRKIPLVKAANRVSALDMETLIYIGYPDALYELVED
ncbi:alpha-glucosidase [Clostridiales bacterium]|nr:alpha-glucosidase [Clostridiales bacterium]